MNYTTNPTQREMSIPEDIICFSVQKIAEVLHGLDSFQNVQYELCIAKLRKK